jgi:hypothetical protein
MGSRFQETPLTRSSYTAGHFELDIDGHKSTAFVKSIDGGFVRGSVADDPIASGNDRVKHITTVDIEPISLEFGMTGANDVLKWIKGSWNKQWARRDGVIRHANFNLGQTYDHEFYQALISETTIPALDGAAKESGYIKCKIQPETVLTTVKKASTERIKGTMGTTAGGPTRQKLWTPSAFALRIDGLDNMRYTNKIEAFTIKQGVKKVYTGEQRFPQIEPTKIEFPNITGTISLAYAEDLLDWHKKYVIDGKKDHGTQRTGAIEFLSPDRSKTIFQINLFEVGIAFAGIQQSTANQDQIKRVKFELFVHRMELDGEGGIGFD